MSSATQFEQQLVKAYNKQFNSVGIAYRLKQAKYQGQFCDILIDHPNSYQACEVKSLTCKNGKKPYLYFSQHFHQTEQIPEYQEYLVQSGRIGWLAVFLRYGRGKAVRGYYIPWSYVWKRYQNDEVKLDFTSDTERLDFYYLSKDEDNDWKLPQEILGGFHR